MIRIQFPFLQNCNKGSLLLIRSKLRMIGCLSSRALPGHRLHPKLSDIAHTTTYRTSKILANNHHTQSFPSDKWDFVISMITYMNQYSFLSFHLFRPFFNTNIFLVILWKNLLNLCFCRVKQYSFGKSFCVKKKKLFDTIQRYAQTKHKRQRCYHNKRIYLW